MDNEPLFLRRGQAVPRKRRAGRWVRLVVVLLVAAAATAGTLRFLGGSLFALKRFEIVGNQRARTEEILAALAPFRLENLILLDLAPLAVRIAREPWVDRVTLAKRFPDGLWVRIEERRPVALFRQDGQLWWVDGGGTPVAPYDARAERADFVLLSGDRRDLPELVSLLEEIRTTRPEYFSALSEISTLPEGGFGMMDSIFRRPVRVLRRDAAEKIRALLSVRGLVESRGWEARAIDLRFADRIVLEGAYGAGNTL
jgi:cell division septal protein FtsQ